MVKHENLSEARRYRRYKALSHYSRGLFRCACCWENTYLFLTIDHINNDGAEHKRKFVGVKNDLAGWLIKNKYPNGFQVLCMNCNFGKRMNNNICPHSEAGLIRRDVWWTNYDFKDKNNLTRVVAEHSQMSC